MSVRYKCLNSRVKEIDEDNRRVRFVVSDGSVDRDNDTIDPDGWELAAYRKNPVVLWAHDKKSPPVAKATSIGVRNGKLVAEAEFADYDFADTIFRLYVGQFLRATSVGFRPVRWSRNEDRGGIDFHEQELVEFSAVPVPSNANALVAAARSGIDTATVKGWARRILGTGADRGPLSHLGPNDPVELPDVDDGDEAVLHLVDEEEPVLHLADETLPESIGRMVRETLAYHRGRID